MCNNEHNTGQHPRKRVVLLVLSVVVLLVSTVFIGVGVVMIGLPLYHVAHQVRTTRHRLMSEVDYETIRRAARHLLAKREDASLPSDDPRIPQAIRNTKPAWISICEKSVEIEYGGGFHHQGFVVVPDGGPPPDPVPDRNFEKLLDGVWFYEDK